MSEFDSRARDWDKNQRFIDRTEAVVKAMLQTIPFKKNMKALEYGSGTALLSFALKDKFAEIVLMDNSQEMTTVTAEKIADQNIQNMKPLFFDLELLDYSGKFDMIYNQMVMHHVQDVDAVLAKFYSLLNPGGFIAIADLYTEDGSFHSGNFNGHLGFDADQLAGKLNTIGFSDVQHQKCYTIQKTDEEGKRTEYPIFLLTASR
jgi:ubiquinone/menaquinone biosynthesis C-methylase UbiE